MKVLSDQEIEQAWAAYERARHPAKLPLFYPGLETRCRARARLTIPLPDFLVDKTGDQ